MKALILAAGRGTRMQPITFALPKPMVPIVNRPIMECLVLHLARAGVHQIAVNTGFLSTEIERYFRGGERFGVRISYSFEGYRQDGRLVDQPLGSAATLRQLQRDWGFFDDTFAVVCGDALIDLDLTQLLRFHRQRGAVATLATLRVPREQVPNYGVVACGPDGRVRCFQEKPRVEEAVSTSANTGIYLFEPEAIERVPEGVHYDIGGDLFPALVQSGAPVYGADIPFQWLDIGRISDYFRVTEMALRGQVHGLGEPGVQRYPGVWTGLNAQVDPAQCRIVPPVYVGGGSVLEPGCTVIGPTVIGAGCVVKSGAWVEGSIVFDHVRIGAPAQLRRLVVCEGYCATADGTVVDVSQSRIEWLIADARSRPMPLSDEQRELAEATRGLDSNGRTYGELEAHAR
ncbi:MAG: NDP-sugar synthase [Candidatus Latescibacterota bacterium]